MAERAYTQIYWSRLLRYISHVASSRLSWYSHNAHNASFEDHFIGSFIQLNLPATSLILFTLGNLDDYEIEINDSTLGSTQKKHLRTSTSQNLVELESSIVDDENANNSFEIRHNINQKKKMVIRQRMFSRTVDTRAKKRTECVAPVDLLPVPFARNQLVEVQLALFL